MPTTALFFISCRWNKLWKFRNTNFHAVPVNLGMDSCQIAFSQQLINMGAARRKASDVI